MDMLLPGEMLSQTTNTRTKPMPKNNFAHPVLFDALDDLKSSCYNVLNDPEVRSDRKELAQLMLEKNGFLQPGNTI